MKMDIMRSAALLTLCALAACSQEAGPPTQGTTTPSPAQAEASPPPTSTPAPVATNASAPLVGDLCWFNEDDVTTEGLVLSFDEEGGAQGQHYGVVHDAENAYFTAFTTTLVEGRRVEGDVWSFTARTEVDGDVQHAEDDWRVTADGAGLAAFEHHHMRPVACDVLGAMVFTEDGVQ